MKRGNAPKVHRRISWLKFFDGLPTEETDSP